MGYSSRFIPQFASVTEPIRRLIKKDTPFKFGPEQRQVFQALKQKLAEAGTLAYFDKKAPTKVIADASPVGIGAVLIQEQNGENVPICYVSRSLTECEQRYSQTEREALSLVWGCERLHPYIYGQNFDLITDHKPLQTIYGLRSEVGAKTTTLWLSCCLHSRRAKHSRLAFASRLWKKGTTNTQTWSWRIRKICGCECYSKGTYDKNCGGSISSRRWTKES